ncbi:hypothetical protein BGZ98_005359 [Dissophora globulifera]|nr:hypothetical protein BGZ98_005359 [Dissophora globulifera]
MSREQRRHSSEDGLVHGTTAGAARSLPLCMQMSKGGQQQATPDVYTVPPKCRMVFHMRDEVSKYKGPIHGSEEDRTGCGEKTSRGAGDGYSPQPQPRRYPPKKSSSNKCTKTVSFREPEPWRECLTAADDIQSTEAATIVVATATVPSYMYSDGVKIADPLAVVSESEDPPLATLKPAMALSSPLIETNLSASDLYWHRNQQSLSQGSHDLKKSLPTAPGAFPLATTPAQPHHHHHQRNMSAPSVTAFIAPSSTSLPQPGVISRSYSSGQPRTPMASGAKSAKSSNSQISGNRFSRLWKSVAHKYNNNPAHGHEVRMQVSDRPGGMVGPRTELEPLVSMG